MKKMPTGRVMMRRTNMTSIGIFMFFFFFSGAVGWEGSAEGIGGMMNVSVVGIRY